MKFRLLAEMGFKSKVVKPNKSTERELKNALRKYILDNDKEALTDRVEGILYLLEHGKYKHLIDPSPHEWAWRFIDATTPKKLESIIGRKLKSSKTSLKLPPGTLNPDDRGLSSWTVNPRSLVYSGFFSVVPKNSNLALVKAKISENRFFGNPDDLVKHLKFPKKYYAPGYALEREIVAVGPVKYETGAYQMRDKSRSLEAQAVDLINFLDPLNNKAEEWNEEYYFPNLWDE